MSEIDTKQEPYRLNDAELDRLAEKPVLGAELAADRLRWTEAEIDRLRADLIAAQGYRAAAEEIAKRRGEMVDALTAERDEARREVCELRADLRSTRTSPEEIAEDRGWDCFRAEADANNKAWRTSDGE
jgi:hypothetical protein